MLPRFGLAWQAEKVGRVKLAVALAYPSEAITAVNYYQETRPYKERASRST